MPNSESAPTGLPVIAPHGDFDAERIGPLAEELHDLASRSAGVVLDLGGVTFGDSSFLNLLLSTHQETDLRLARVPPGVSRLFSVTGTDSILRVFRSVEEAQAVGDRG